MSNCECAVKQVVLDENLVVSNIQEFSVFGSDDYTEVVCSNDSRYGLTFIDVCNVTITNMHFTGCGTWKNGFQDLKFHYALFVSSSRFLSVLHSRISNSLGTGLVLLNNYNVCISHSHFSHNALSSHHFDKDTSFGGGGGIYLCIEGSCGRRDECASTHVIEHCTFSGNRASVFYSSANSVSGVGNGGGLEVWVHNSSSNHLQANNLTFLNNSAVWGGAMQIVFASGSQSNDVYFDGMTVDSNSVPEKGGGGLSIGYIGGNVTNNNVSLRNVTFFRNIALFGGGLAVFTFSASEHRDNVIECANCTWTSNKAHYGGAINIAPQRVLPNNKEIILRFVDCLFESNLVYPKTIRDGIQRNGKAIIMLTGGVITFVRQVLFIMNNSTCIYAMSSTVLFSRDSNSLFLNNSARSGGGISLIGFSVIVVSENTSITFCNNSVIRHGAAIYYYSIDKNAYVYARTCFLEKLDPDQNSSTVNLNFFGNTARTDDNKMIPDAIYGTSLKTCSYSTDNNEYAFYDVGNFRYCNTCEGSLQNIESASCEKSGSPVVSDEGNVSVTLNGESQQFIPGKRFAIPVSVNNGKLKSSSHAYIRNHGNSTITIPHFFSVTRSYLKLHGNPGDTATLVLTEVFFRKLTVSIEVQALDCPPLYTIKNSSCVCVSTEDVNFVEFHTCARGDYKAKIRLGYWIDYIEISNEEQKQSDSSDRYALLSSYCPLGYCSNASVDEDYLALPSRFSTLELNDAICNSRHGTLCGLCSNDTTVYFHSEQFRCGETDLCHWGPLFYLLSEILPLTLLFVFIIFFDISFTSGYLNGFIFYAQMYDTISNVSSSFISSSYQFSTLSIFHRLFFKMFNIDFFDIDVLSFCLFKTQNTLNILLIKYLTVGYAFFLVLGTVWLIQFCSKFRFLKLRKSKYSVIQGLSAFLVMVYSQCTYLSLSILNLIYIYRGTESYKVVVFLQGNITYFSVQHLPYAIPALLCLLLFVAPLPLLLLAYPLCNKIVVFLKMDENRGFKFASRLVPVTKIKPLLDCFQGTFKDNYRFFAGLYFVYRVMILSSRLVTGVILIFMVIEIELIFMLALHSFVWPYQNKIHNLIDLVVLPIWQ